MTIDEAIEILDQSIYHMDWEYPMEYAAALDMALRALDLMKKERESKMVMLAYMNYYSKALELDNIRNPVAWALYKTWKDADGHPRKFK